MKRPPFKFKGAEVRHVGGSKGDETFTLRTLGMLNITKMARFFHARPELFDLRRVPLIPEFTEPLFAARELDPYRLATMSAEEVDSSAALAVIHQGSLEPVDGNHYIRKAAELGRPFVRVAILPARLVPRFLIRFEVREGKRWREISSDELLEAMEGTFAGPDGVIRDAAGNVIDRYPMPVRRGS